jgi:hypothetical protein
MSGACPWTYSVSSIISVFEIFSASKYMPDANVLFNLTVNALENDSVVKSSN